MQMGCDCEFSFKSISTSISTKIAHSVLQKPPHRNLVLLQFRPEILLCASEQPAAVILIFYFSYELFMLPSIILKNSKYRNKKH